MADIAALLTDAFHIELELRCESEPNASFRVADFSLTEALSETYRCDLELLTEDAVEPTKMLGRNASLVIRRGGAERFVHGMVTRVEHGGVASAGTHNAMILRVQLEPALCALKHTRDSRIFQAQTVVDILREVLSTGLSAYGRSFDLDKLKADYHVREYTVQYAESDYDFVARLAAQEGIGFFFDHAGEVEKLVFADDNADFQTFETLDGQPVPLSQRADENPDTEPVLAFVRQDEQGETSSVMRDFDWTRPTLELKHEELVPDAQGKERIVYASTGETTTGTYDQGAKTYTKNDLSLRAKLLQERLHVSDQTYAGEGLVTGFMAGRVFELVDHVIPELDGRYVLTSVTHYGGESAGREQSTDRYRNHFTASPFELPHRPTPVTPWPRIHSIQTATVVGPAASELHTDEHGRIRVQFHWDRQGKRDDHSSCFIRVAQAWAGAGYGFVFIPRIGHEVIVSFIEGNPDRPLVTGSVYNGSNAPFYELTANETRSVIRTKTFGDGTTGYNEISFDDQPGNEELFLHASHNMKEVVENDHNTTVHGSQTNNVDGSQTEGIGGDQAMTVGANRTKDITADETTTVGGNRTETVTGDETITITGARTEAVTGDETITIAANRTESVGVSESVTIGANRSHTVGASETIAIGTTRELTVGAAETISVGGVRNVSVGGAQTTEIGAVHSLSVGGPQSIDIGGKRTTDIGKDDSLKVGKKLVIDVADEITIKTGDATISMKKNGDITIKGKNITLQGSGKINIKASSDVVIKGSKVGAN